MYIQKRNATKIGNIIFRLLLGYNTEASIFEKISGFHDSFQIFYVIAFHVVLMNV